MSTVAVCLCHGHLLYRHNLVRDALFFDQGIFPSIKNALVTCLGHTTVLRPMNLLVAGDDFDNDCVDISVMSPLVTSSGCWKEELHQIWIRLVRFGRYTTCKAVATCPRRVRFAVQPGVTRSAVKDCLTSHMTRGLHRVHLYHLNSGLLSEK